MFHNQLEHFFKNGWTIIKCEDLLEINMSEYYNIWMHEYSQVNLQRPVTAYNYDHEIFLYKNDIENKSPLVKNLFYLLQQKSLNFLNSVGLEDNLFKEKDRITLSVNRYHGPNKDKPYLLPHLDPGVITVLPKATNDGLQIWQDDKWIDVLPADDELVIIAGEMLTRLTNGKVPAPLHQVAYSKNKQDRYSTFLVVYPDARHSIQQNFTLNRYDQDGNRA